MPSWMAKWCCYCDCRCCRYRRRHWRRYRQQQQSKQSNKKNNNNKTCHCSHILDLCVCVAFELTKPNQTITTTSTITKTDSVVTDSEAMSTVVGVAAAAATAAAVDLFFSYHHACKWLADFKWSRFSKSISMNILCVLISLTLTLPLPFSRYLVMALEQFEATIIYAISHLAFEQFNFVNEFSLVSLFCLIYFIIFFPLLSAIIEQWYCCGAWASCIANW